MDRPRVFVVQQPTGRDSLSGAVRHTMNLTPASKFGQLNFILSETANPFKDISQTARCVHNYLVQHQFGPEDFVLLVGNPILIAVVGAVAASLSGKLRLLQWDRGKHSYRPVTVQLPVLAGGTDRG